MRYWVSAIVQNDGNKKPWLLEICESQFSLEEAMEEISFIKTNYTVLSAWVDTFDECGIKQTVFHECYINVFGDIYN